MKILIKKVGTKFCVDPVLRSGSPRVGWGSTMDAAMGDFLRAYQEELGIEIVLDASAEPAEKERRRRALSTR